MSEFGGLYQMTKITHHAPKMVLRVCIKSVWTIRKKKIN